MTITGQTTRTGRLCSHNTFSVSFKTFSAASKSKKENGRMREDRRFGKVNVSDPRRCGDGETGRQGKAFFFSPGRHQGDDNPAELFRL